MIDDPIVAEVRKARDEYARRFNYNVDAICKDLQKKQLQSGRKLVALPPRRPNPVGQAGSHALAKQGAQAETEKPGN